MQELRKKKDPNIEVQVLLEKVYLLLGKVYFS